MCNTLLTRHAVAIVTIGTSEWIANQSPNGRISTGRGDRGQPDERGTAAPERLTATFPGGVSDRARGDEAEDRCAFNWRRWYRSARPESAAVTLPAGSMPNTIIGIPLSMQRLNAVESTTLRPRTRAS